MPDCIFCKIGRHEVPAKVVYEDQDTIAFYDIAPKSPGHTLLIPKSHHQWFQDLPDSVSDPLFRAAKTVAHKLKVDHKADFVRMNIVGTDVPHVHIHLFPQSIQPGESPAH
ncbi:MAG: HIT domain-containing protein [Patescibacteria group bacterium]